MFQPATRLKSKLRMALCGPAGSGKSYTALMFAFAIAGEHGRVAGIDTEHGRLRKYAGTQPDGANRPWNFDVVELQHFAPTAYTHAINEAGKLGYDVLVVDSLSHAWAGVGGALEQVDKKGGNSYTAWKDVTPQHNELIETIHKSTCHLVCTMRSKMDYVLEQDSRGKMVPTKVGMAPVQRAGFEYEFDFIADFDLTHTMRVSKQMGNAVDGAVVNKPNASFMEPILAWLNQGAAPPVVSFAPVDDGRPAWKCTGPQEAQIQQLFGSLAELDPAKWTRDYAVGILNRVGANRIAELDYNSARELTVALQQAFDLLVAEKVF